MPVQEGDADLAGLPRDQGPGWPSPEGEETGACVAWLRVESYFSSDHGLTRLALPAQGVSLKVPPPPLPLPARSLTHVNTSLKKGVCGGW